MGASEGNDTQTAISDTALSNQSCSPGSILQTFYAKFRGKNKEKTIRRLNDSGSQRSYLNTRMAEEMQYDCLKEENIIYNLLRGKKYGKIIVGIKC